MTVCSMLGLVTKHISCCRCLRISSSRHYLRTYLDPARHLPAQHQEYAVHEPEHKDYSGDEDRKSNVHRNQGYEDFRQDQHVSVSGGVLG